MTDCVFCKIAAGEIPASVVYEDDKVIAKQHFSNIGDGLPDDLMGHLFNTVKKVAEIKGINKTGYRVIVNTGDDAQQSVHHIHVHVLGGAPMNSGSPAL